MDPVSVADIDLSSKGKQAKLMTCQYLDQYLCVRCVADAILQAN